MGRSRRYKIIQLRFLICISSEVILPQPDKDVQTTLDSLVNAVLTASVVLLLDGGQDLVESLLVAPPDGGRPPCGRCQRDGGGRREELTGVLRDDRLVEVLERHLGVELKSRGNA